jgi:hypothetical protein
LFGNDREWKGKDGEGRGGGEGRAALGFGITCGGGPCGPHLEKRQGRGHRAYAPVLPHGQCTHRCAVGRACVLRGQGGAASCGGDCPFLPRWEARRCCASHGAQCCEAAVGRRKCPCAATSDCSSWPLLSHVIRLDTASPPAQCLPVNRALGTRRGVDTAHPTLSSPWETRWWSHSDSKRARLLRRGLDLPPRSCSTAMVAYTALYWPAQFHAVPARHHASAPRELISLGKRAVPRRLDLY